MKITNTTKQEISVKIKGTEYVLESEGSLSNVPVSHATYWLSLHPFLESESEGSDEVKEVVEEVTEEVEKVEVEEVAEEVESVEVVLEDLKREELDEIATELGLKPEDFKNKKDIIKAIKN